MLNKSTDLAVMLVQCDLGGAKYGASNGGEHVMNLLNRDTILENIVSSQALCKTKSETPFAHFLEQINESLQEVAIKTEALLLKYPHEKPLLFSGDHSTAAGTISGIKKAYPQHKIGAIWIDAHADIHSPYTTPSGNVHGMPVAAAIGMDHKHIACNDVDQSTELLWNITKDICDASLKVEDLVYIGIRDLEEAEWGILKDNNICYFCIESLRDIGINNVVDKALEKLSHCDSLYLSFDIDSMDASLVPGTGTPVENGLFSEEIEEILVRLYQHEKVRLLEISEINPHIDSSGRTVEEIARILNKVI